MLLHVAFAGSLLAARVVLAEELESDAVYLPATGARTLTVRNMTGTVRVQGWDRPDVRIVAHKRAGSAEVLSRLRVRADFGDGRIRVTTGFYLSDGTFNPLPLDGAAIDLAIEAPRQLALAVATFRGDVHAAGFRAGAQLSSQQGHIKVADVAGPVDTRALDGNQWFETIRGTLAARGVVGDLELEDIQGQQVEAIAFRGRVSARDVDAQVVRLHTTIGTVIYIGGLRPGARYDLLARDGDVRVELPGLEGGLQLVARAPTVSSVFPLRAAGRATWRSVELAPPSPIEGVAIRTSPASLEARSVTGSVDLRRRD